MRWTVLYDGGCGFCRWCTGVLLAWDRRGALRPAELRSAEADRLLAGMGDLERYGSWHLVAPDGTVHSRGRAAAPLLRLLPGGRPMAAVIARAPRLADRAYAAAVRHRSTLGRLVGPAARARADRRLAARA
ncbi:MAG: DCC1-like thiol-disulfide oxidoreductase family protein [Thermoleophilia bacterium]